MTSNGKGATCTYCERPLESTSSGGRLAATRDHVVPRSKWAPIDRVYGPRKVWCCRQCNTLKADMLPAEWSAFMRRNPEWWKRPDFQVGMNVPDPHRER